MLPENYYPRAGDMFEKKGSLFVFVNTDVDTLALLCMNDRYSRSVDDRRNLTIWKGRPIRTNEVFTDHESAVFLGHVDFGKIAKDLLNDFSKKE